jgi:hypothetical protein
MFGLLTALVQLVTECVKKFTPKPQKEVKPWEDPPPKPMFWVRTRRFIAWTGLAIGAVLAGAFVENGVENWGCIGTFMLSSCGMIWEGSEIFPVIFRKMFM